MLISNLLHLLYQTQKLNSREDRENIRNFRACGGRLSVTMRTTINTLLCGRRESIYSDDADICGILMDAKTLRILWICRFKAESCVAGRRMSFSRRNSRVSCCMERSRSSRRYAARTPYLTGRVVTTLGSIEPDVYKLEQPVFYYPYTRPAMAVNNTAGFPVAYEWREDYEDYDGYVPVDVRYWVLHGAGHEPTPIPPQDEDLRVISTDPRDGETGVSPSTDITEWAGNIKSMKRLLPLNRRQPFWLLFLC